MTSGRKRPNTNTQIVSVAAKRSRRPVIIGVVDDGVKAQQKNLRRSGANDIIDKAILG